MDFITHVQQALLAQLPGVMRQYAGDLRADSLSEMEIAVRQMTHQIGNAVMQQWLEAQDEKYPADQQPCPRCGELADYQRRREGMSLTLQGRVYYRRAYYGCPHCHQGHYPLDRRLGIQPGEMSAEVIRLAALAGVQDAFGAGSQLLAQAALLELSPNSIRKACQQVGEAIMRQEQMLIDRSQDLAHQPERRREVDKPQRLYGSMDGFFVLLEDGWREMKGGVWWQVDGQGRACQAHYYVDTVPADSFADLVWATGFEHQADQASELIFVADGAEWIWNLVQQHYTQAVQIVDWFHACQYLSAAAAAFKDPGQRRTWLEAVRQWLWDGEVDAVIAACAQLVNPALSRE